MQPVVFLFLARCPEHGFCKQEPIVWMRARAFTALNRMIAWLVAWLKIAARIHGTDFIV